MTTIAAAPRAPDRSTLAPRRVVQLGSTRPPVQAAAAPAPPRLGFIAQAKEATAAARRATPHVDALAVAVHRLAEATSDVQEAGPSRAEALLELEAALAGVRLALGGATRGILDALEGGDLTVDRASEPDVEPSSAPFAHRLDGQE